MITLAFILLVITPLACLGLNRVLTTRRLAFGSAAVVGLAALLALAARLRADTGLLLNIPYVTLNVRAPHLLLRIAEADWVIVIAMLAIGSVALLGLGLALPADVLGFAGVPAAFTLTLLMTLAGMLSSEPLLEPAFWLLAVVMCSIALRASGLMIESDAPLVVLLTGVIALIVLMASQQISGSFSAASLILACLLLIGATPFGAIATAIGEAPAGMGGALLAAGLPLLGGHTLLQTMTPEITRQAGPLLTIIGIAMLCVGAARALNERRGRLLIAWQHGAQYGLFVIAVAQGGVALTRIAPILLLSAALSTLTTSLVISLLERRAGTDDLAELQIVTPMLLPGLALLVGGASAVGIPGTLGMWGRIWLYEHLLQSGNGWATGLILAGSAMLALSYAAPLAAIWRGAGKITPLLSTPFRLNQALPALIALSLLILGCFPPIGPEPAIDTTTRVIALLAGLLLAGVPLVIMKRSLAPEPANRDERANGAAFPAAFAESVGGLGWLAAPSSGLNLAWLALLQICQMLAWLLAWIERRYYLAGLTIALIITILIFL